MPDPEHARTLTGSELRDLLRTDGGDGGGRPVIVDFWDPLCSACRATIGTVDELACRFDDRAVVGTLNVRDHTDAARHLGIESVPTLIVFRDGTPEHTLTSAETIQAFSQRIEEDVFGGKKANC